MKVVLFDIDGTLLLLKGAGRAAVDRAARQAFGLALPAAVSLHGNTDRGIVADLIAAHALDAAEADFARFQAAYLAALAELMPADHTEPLPGVRALLDRLAGVRDRVAVGLLTGNVRLGAEAKLTHFGLLPDFDPDGRGPWGGFGDDHADRADVARAAWAATLARCGPDVDRSDVWVVGDTVRDVACAAAIGVRCLAVTTGGSSPETLRAAGAAHVVTDLADVDDVWDRLQLD